MGRKLRCLRRRCRLSMRQLARQAGVSLGYVSGVEAGRISCTLAMLRKLLVAMGGDLGLFFSENAAPPSGCVFRREAMRSVADRRRTYTFLLPKRREVTLEMLDEELSPGERPEFESFPGELAGYVLDGELRLEIEGESAEVLRPGDAFHVPPGRPVRGRSVGKTAARLVTARCLKFVGEATAAPVRRRGSRGQGSPTRSSG